jgi:hypothetical protein
MVANKARRMTENFQQPPVIRKLRANYPGETRTTHPFRGAPSLKIDKFSGRKVKNASIT